MLQTLVPAAEPLERCGALSWPLGSGFSGLLVGRLHPRMSQICPSRRLSAPLGLLEHHRGYKIL